MDRKISKSNRGKGYRVENDCRKYFKNKGYLAIRVPTMLQRRIPEFRSIDVIVVTKGIIVQCKYRKELLGEPEKLRILEAKNQHKGLTAKLCYRKRGLVFEPIQ